MMKYSFLFALSVLCSLRSTAQPKGKIESLDSFFGGVPLQQSFEAWFRYVHDNPDLGIDSTNEQGNYSSFKPGIRSHFPFPDSMLVKMLFKKIVYYDSLTRKPVDSITTIMIEGVSGDNKSGRKQSIGIFKFLRKQLRSFYRSRDDEPFQAATLFSKGINRSFPDCLLYQGHSDELKFYFVIILYAFPPGREISFKLPGYN